MAVLVLGGLGYIGSNTVAEILQTQSSQVIAFDNLSNTSLQRLSQIQKEVGSEAYKNFNFIGGDIRSDLYKVLTRFAVEEIEHIIHFAALKSVDQSFNRPLDYYSTNVHGTIEVLRFAETLPNLKTLVFSSSATVYGDNSQLPLVEDSPLSSTNPYGQTKIQCEAILRDFSQSFVNINPNFKAIALRYFNPVGASKKGFLGDDLSSDPPASLFPSIANYQSRNNGEFVINGGDYPTSDGTCVRDFISVHDLAKAHLAAIQADKLSEGFHAINVGSGTGYSIKEVLSTFEQYLPITYRIGERRPGDVAEGFADVSKAKLSLGWEAQDSLDTMVKSELNVWNSRDSR